MIISYIKMAGFIDLGGEMVGFQIKSSQKAAEKHMEKYPDVPVIMVNPGASIKDLDENMQEIFKVSENVLADT